MPLGYLPEFDGARFVAVPDPERAPIIAEAFRYAARPGSSVSSVLREVTALGLTSHAGKPLAKSAMHAILTNPFYAGSVTYRDGRYPGQHRPLVSRTLFEAVQRHLRARRSQAGGTRYRWISESDPSGSSVQLECRSGDPEIFDTESS